ncbi:uncharacterized protein LOC114307164 isoform X4 [Camellia sinensis]|uniref:uncharacterized protein LOC114307164 isoform X4 n=1 Tax=Camellia sinensis TaxID=4442 RepID=UPI0010366752|nr:uncharacterized protein LOC114307164 isoform X4 [Camellia sinensis]XP_028108362.1 uncharacterized protein LOC114307164 isoform X5 [Camellia sinensis]XP_028108363.1 uncharacterized protein LOC114307164 isoform X4 [Camellia sinensis]
MYRSTMSGAILPYSQALEKIAPHIQQACVYLCLRCLCTVMKASWQMLLHLVNYFNLGTTSQHSFYQLTHQVKWLVTTMNSCLTFLHNQILLLTERQHKSCRIRMFPLILSLTRRGCGTSLPSMEHR